MRADNGIMPSQVIVPHRPGPLVAVSERDAREPVEWHDSGIGTPEILLTLAGAGLLAAEFAAGLPDWLIVIAIACLALGLLLPANAAFVGALRRRAERRRLHALGQGTPLDLSDAAVRRLVAAYDRLRRTAEPGSIALDAGHLAVVEVARLLDGRAPGAAQIEYVVRRAEAVSTLADRVAAGPVSPVETADPDALARIEALLG